MPIAKSVAADEWVTRAQQEQRRPGDDLGVAAVPAPLLRYGSLSTRPCRSSPTALMVHGEATSRLQAVPDAGAL